MSSNTKIVVLKLKELVISGIIAALVIMFLTFLVIYITTKGNDKNTGNTLGTYAPGVYTSSIVLSGTTMDLEVTVDTDNIKSIRLINTAEAIETMYPLITSSVKELETQIKDKGTTKGVTYSADAKYTSLVLLNAIDNALKKAKR